MNNVRFVRNRDVGYCNSMVFVIDKDLFGVVKEILYTYLFHLRARRFTRSLSLSMVFVY